MSSVTCSNHICKFKTILIHTIGKALIDIFLQWMNASDVFVILLILLFQLLLFKSLCKIYYKRKKESNSINSRKLKIIKWKDVVVLKSGFHLSKKYFICFNTRPLEMMKDTFYFILKAYFILKIFKFLCWLFGHVEKTIWLKILD